MKGSDRIQIKIIGTNCSNGMKLKKMVKRAIENNKETIEIEECNDEKSKNKFHVSNILGLVVNDKLICQGKVLTTREIEKIFA